MSKVFDMFIVQVEKDYPVVLNAVLDIIFGGLVFRCGLG